MVPHTASTSSSATLNVNSLGAKMIRRGVSINTSTTVAPDNSSWLAANKPIQVTYNGLHWIADLPKPYADDLYGSVPISNGGTGATDAATALANLGAASASDLNTIQNDLATIDGKFSNYSTTEEMNAAISSAIETAWASVATAEEASF